MGLLRTDEALSRTSYYAATAPQAPAHPALDGTVEADVAIVGGGLAGLSAAIELADRGHAVVVLEAREFGWGASGRNGGQAIAGLACEQDVIEAQLGLDEARRVWAMTLEALDLIGERIARFGIDCDWRPGYLSLAVNARKGAELQRWQARMAEVYGHETRWLPPGELRGWIDSPRFHSGVHDPRSGHLHPLKYTRGLAAAAASLGVRLHEQSAVTRLEPGEPCVLHTAGGRVRASHVLLAGNVYLQDLVPVLAPRIMPVGTYLVASERLDPARAAALIPCGAACCDTNFVLDYFRPGADHRMVYGGRVSYSTATPPNLAAGMRRRMVATFPQLAGVDVEYAWGGFVDISMNRAPDFGRVSDRMAGGAEARAWRRVVYLQGFSGHGLALTGLAGKLVAEAIDGDASRFDTFARLQHRRFPGGALLRTPALVAGMAYYRLKDLL
ncbi:FAD-binding oxidoreductase [Piscinibacter sakaiensis]|uniref:Oxidoreductase n=1 Tax=Piscinibacter sakaiensis TaxID=1547922 RepID=A0A0K8NWC4_PISS1|nr:FAD-binding oxidoreductase [Piscinibacter sakaiensis]GAP34692.1 oxidoreductase [Piscinibacter sakaiensis]